MLKMKVGRYFLYIYNFLSKCFNNHSKMLLLRKKMNRKMSEAYQGEAIRQISSMEKLAG